MGTNRRSLVRVERELGLVLALAPHRERESHDAKGRRYVEHVHERPEGRWTRWTLQGREACPRRWRSERKESWPNEAEAGVPSVLRRSPSEPAHGPGPEFGTHRRRDLLAHSRKNHWVKPSEVRNNQAAWGRKGGSGSLESARSPSSS